MRAASDRRARGWFRPILPGATLRSRLVGSVGALLSLSLTALICSLVTGNGYTTALLVAPMGATAVLLFAVPASPLAQPWPIVGGNGLSALIGVAAAIMIGSDIVAAGVAVGAAIAVMAVTRCLHPPGGAAALLAVLGGSEITDLGFGFAFVPVALNAAVLTLCGVAFHRIVGERYPWRAEPAPKNAAGTLDQPANVRIGFNETDVEQAIADMGHSIDISRDDLVSLIRGVQARTLDRTHGKLVVADIMARDVIRVSEDAAIEDAKAILIRRGIRTLPVVSETNRVLGSVGLRELLGEGARVRDVMTVPVKVAADDDALDLAKPLTDGRHHAAVVVDDEQRLIGIVTQTDLLVAMARTPPQPAPDG